MDMAKVSGSLSVVKVCTSMRCVKIGWVVPYRLWRFQRSTQLWTYIYMHLRHECIYTSIKLYTYSGPEKMSWSIHSFCNEKNGFRTKTHKPQRQSWNIWTKPGGWALENHQPDAIVFHQPQEPANYLIFQNLSKPSLGNIGYWIHLDTDFCQGDHKGPLKRCRRHFPPGRSLSCHNRRHQARLLFHPRSRGKVHQWPWAGPEWLQNMEWSNVKQEKFRVLKVILCNYCLCTYLYLIIAPVRLSEVKLPRSWYGRAADLGCFGSSTTWFQVSTCIWIMT
jgi:hypothetical protein